MLKEFFYSAQTGAQGIRDKQDPDEGAGERYTNLVTVLLGSESGRPRLSSLEGLTLLVIAAAPA